MKTTEQSIAICLSTRSFAIFQKPVLILFDKAKARNFILIIFEYFPYWNTNHEMNNNEKKQSRIERISISLCSISNQENYIDVIHFAGRQRGTFSNSQTSNSEPSSNDSLFPSISKLVYPFKTTKISSLVHLDRDGYSYDA